MFQAKNSVMYSIEFCSSNPSRSNSTYIKCLVLRIFEATLALIIMVAAQTAASAQEIEPPVFYFVPGIVDAEYPETAKLDGKNTRRQRRR